MFYSYQSICRWWCRCDWTVSSDWREDQYTMIALMRLLRSNKQVLELFCLQEYVLPNLFVGRLARESCSAAFEAGISAELIVDYTTVQYYQHRCVIQRLV